MKLRVLWVGKNREAWLKEAVANYAARIRRYAPLQLCEVRDEKGAEVEEMRQRECERLERQIPPAATLVILDAQGEQMDSPGLADFIGKQRDAGVGELVFAIGGAYGFSRNSVAGAKCSPSRA